MLKKLVLIFSTCFVLSAFADKPAKPLVAYFSKGSKGEFEQTAKPFLASHFSMDRFEVTDMTPYKEDGQADLTQLPEKLAQLPAEVSFVYLSWNEAYASTLAPLVESLKKVASQKLILGPAGYTNQKNTSAPLKSTMLAQLLPDVLIVGDMGERETFPRQMFFGPEMLTAVRLPKSVLREISAAGASAPINETTPNLGPLYFMGRLAESWRNRPAQEWAYYLRNRKAKIKRIWPDVEDFFPH